jgi:hypothetical protein
MPLTRERGFWASLRAQRVLASARPWSGGAALRTPDLAAQNLPPHHRRVHRTTSPAATAPSTSSPPDDGGPTPLRDRLLAAVAHARRLAARPPSRRRRPTPLRPLPDPLGRATAAADLAPFDWVHRRRAGRTLPVQSLVRCVLGQEVQAAAGRWRRSVYSRGLCQGGLERRRRTSAKKKGVWPGRVPPKAAQLPHGSALDVA